MQQGDGRLVSLPKFNVAPDMLSEHDSDRKRNIHKSLRIDEELEERIEYMIHDPKLGFGGRFSAFAVWAFEQGVYACAKVVGDPKAKALVDYYHEARNSEVMQQHLLKMNEQTGKDAAVLEQWIKADEADGALSFLEEMVARLEHVPVGKWYRFLARKVLDNEAVQRTLEIANAGTAKQMQRAAAISRTLEAATGQ